MDIEKAITEGIVFKGGKSPSRIRIIVKNIIHVIL